MHDLRLVGVHEDGEHLLLSGSDGEQYLLPVDEPLRAAVRRDRAHLGQLQIAMSGDLRPREVQAQIRAGATAEDVAERSGWPLERVRRYEGAVLAEREHIAELARGVTLRRRGADATPPTLTYRVEQRLAARGVDTTLMSWDSARAEDGPWMLVLRFVAGGREREARWLYDGVARTVTAQDDEAMWLSEDEHVPAPPVAAPHLAAVPTVSAAPSAASDPTELYDVDADGGVDQPEAVTLDAPSAVDLVGAMRQRRHGRRRQPPAIELPDAPARRAPRQPGAGGQSAGEQEHLDLEPLMFDPSLLGEPTVPHPFPFPERLREQPEPAEPATDSPSDQAAAPASSPERPERPEGTESTERPVAVPVQNRSSALPHPPRGFAPPQRPAPRRPQAAAEPVPVPATRTAAPGPSSRSADDTGSHRRPRRASVPSWDEIMFGSKRD